MIHISQKEVFVTVFESISQCYLDRKVVCVFVRFVCHLRTKFEPDKREHVLTKVYDFDLEV